MSRVTYVSMSTDEAVDEGILPESLRPKYEDYYSVIMTVDGESTVIGDDGGDPEDMTLYRNFDWVDGALQMAYALGLKHGKEAQ